MKVTKRQLYDGIGADDEVDDSDVRKYLRTITYWIGYFIMEFNLLDTVVTEAIAEKIDGGMETNEYAYIFISGMTFNQKVELLQRYHQYMLPIMYGAITEKDQCKGYLSRLDDLVEALKVMGNTRNIIAHTDYHTLDNDGNVVGKVKIEKGRVEQHLIAITRDFLVENINKTYELIDAVDEFEEDVHL